MSDKVLETRTRVDKTTGEKVSETREMPDAEVRQMNAGIERVIERVHNGRPEPNRATAPADPYDLEEDARDVLKGADRKPDVWKQVMEYYGFTWMEPHQLDRHVGHQRYIPATFKGLTDEHGLAIYNNRLYWTRPHGEGQWRPDVGRKRPHPALARSSFTVRDLCSFYGTPEKFDQWAKAEIEKWNRTKGQIRKR